MKEFKKSELEKPNCYECKYRGGVPGSVLFLWGLWRL